MEGRHAAHDRNSPSGSVDNLKDRSTGPTTPGRTERVKSHPPTTEKRDPRISDKIPEVPTITGRIEVNLTVRDPVRSATWYAELLGMQRLYEFVSPDDHMHYISLVEPESGLVLSLVGHAANPGEPFQEVVTGLDHLEFMVESREELYEWAHRLDDLGIAHSGVKEPSYTQNAMLTFRDPDRIQLEFFWRSPRRADG